MTEEEWLTSTDVAAILSHMDRVSSIRERQLFLLNCAQRVCHLLGPGTRRHPTRELLVEAYEAVERGIESSLASRVGESAQREATRTSAILDRAVAEAIGTRQRHAIRIASREAVAANLIHDAITRLPRTLLSGAGWDIDDELSLRHSELEDYRDEVCRENLPALRCIVGNPFRPVAFDPRWGTEHAVGLAAKMYDERNFDAMPILADALEEAGCDNRAVLDHCREPGLHARGCWVVDAILGKR